MRPMDKTAASTIQPLTLPATSQELLQLVESAAQEMQRVCGLPSEWTRYQTPCGPTLVNWLEIERQCWRRLLNNLPQ